ncbi:tRNA (adenosine(37)-N6)-threonylcarbamoyltransferase complex ATPase subunit type 1 TsaE [PVC group bacterium]|nr:tRNA (adenosine(37)-N6)-threonylcarbamoyltransferase complex ATPase subunit type 1 TsaE [PVC group bacterium]
MPTNQVIVSHSPEETMRLAGVWTTLVEQRGAIGLTGDIGSGKTVFVKGLAVALGIEATLVTSPTFTLIHEYPGKTPLFHFDVYRMNDKNDVFGIGVDEYFSKDGIVAIEWADKVRPVFLKSYTWVEFSFVAEKSRKLNFFGYGDHSRVIRAMSEQCENTQ